MLIMPKNLETDVSEIGFDEFKKAVSPNRRSYMTVVLPRVSMGNKIITFAAILEKMKAISPKNGINMSALSDRLSKMNFGDIISITDMTVDEEGSRITSRAYVTIRSMPGKFIAYNPSNSLFMTKPRS